MSHPKGVLIERAQKLGLPKPEFRTEQTGPEHEPRFLSDVLIDGEVLGTGQGGTKRTAETYAAEEALAALEARQPTDKATGKKAAASSKGAVDKKGKGGKAAKAKPSRESTVEPAAAAGRSRADEEEPVAATQDEGFDGPWPMFDDLLAAVVTVAERRVTSDLRGESARTAIRDFSLDLYKELLLGLGDIVDDEEDAEEEED